MMHREPLKRDVRIIISDFFAPQSSEIAFRNNPYRLRSSNVLGNFQF